MLVLFFLLNKASTKSSHNKTKAALIFTAILDTHFIANMWLKTPGHHEPLYVDINIMLSMHKVLIETKLTCQLNL